MDHLHETNININDNTPNILDARSYAASMVDKEYLHLGKSMQEEDKEDFKIVMRK